MNITLKHSPFGSNRPQKPNAIIVHAMAEKINSNGVVYYAVDWLFKLKLSAHILVYPNGKVVRCRTDKEGAYHARGNNTNTLGIEFLMSDIHNYATFLETLKTDYVTDVQFEAGVQVVKNWISNLPITTIKRHSDIDPGRKVDPGSGFNWQDFLYRLGV